MLGTSWLGYERHDPGASTGVWLRRDAPHDTPAWDTILGDVAELYDFVPGGGE